MKNNNTKKNKGFVILFAMLISTLILLISAGIYTIVEKQLVLASTSKESQKAFYAADSALECALFHDLGARYIEDREGTAFPTEGDAPENISCGGNDLGLTRLDGTTASYDLSDEAEDFSNFNVPYVFRYYSEKSAGTCAYVLVEKKVSTEQEGLADRILTRITAAGFNSCVSDDEGVLSPDINDPSLLERRISIRYVNTMVNTADAIVNPVTP